MEQLLADIFFYVFFMGGSISFIIFGSIMAVKQYKRDAAKQKQANSTIEPAPIEPEFTTVTIKATVVDQSCCVKTIGTKTPRTVKEFVIVFQTENSDILKLTVPEEMYDGFEQGQTGMLSIVDGELYGFDLN